MLKKIGVPAARFLYEKSLRYLAKNNPHSARVVPDGASAPVFMLHTGASLKGGGIDHLKPWIPLLDALGMEYIVVTRMMDVYERMTVDYPHVRTSLVKSSADADALLEAFPSLAGFFYLSNTANCNQFLRYPGYRHVFLGHGDSDKHASMNRLFKAYDEIFVAGQAHIDRFAAADFDASAMHFRIIGRPDSRPLLAGLEQRQRGAPHIIYIPTWEGYYADQNYSSLALAASLLETAHRVSGLPIIGKLHPVTGAVREEYRNSDKRIAKQLGLDASQLRFVDRHGKLTDLLDPAAIYICDISATVSECLVMDRPIFVYIPRDQQVRIINSRLSYSDYAYTFSSAEELGRKLDRVVNGDDWLAEARRKARDYFITPKATLSGAFEQAMRSIAARDREAPGMRVAGVRG